MDSVDEAGQVPPLVQSCRLNQNINRKRYVNVAEEWVLFFGKYRGLGTDAGQAVMTNRVALIIWFNLKD